jgi:hypothetical protein
MLSYERGKLNSLIFCDTAHTKPVRPVGVAVGVHDATVEVQAPAGVAIDRTTPVAAVVAYVAQAATAVAAVPGSRQK